MEKMEFGTTGSTAHKQALKGNFGGTVKVLNGPLECPANIWSSAAHVDMVKDRVAEVCKAGSALGVYLEMDQCSRSDCLECEGLKDIFESCQENGSCPHCPTWTQFVRSSAPTVTPIRVESPQFDDWAKNYGSRNSAYIGTSSLYWKLIVSLGCLLLLTGSQCRFEYS